MKKKIVLLVVLLLLLAALSAFALFGDVILDFLMPVKNDWKLDERTGLSYYMDENGDPVTGWFDQDDLRYYLDPAKEGARASGWTEVDGKTYYFHDSGPMATGWQNLDGTDYYFAEDGAMVTGWVETNGAKRYLGTDGKLVKGWLELEDGTYYLDGQGAATTGWAEIDGKRHYFSASGTLCRGWVDLEDGTYYLDDQGSPVTGWLELDDSRYYLDENGKLYRGWLEMEGGRFFVLEDGSIATGWVEDGGKRYYLNEDGTPATGWLEQDGNRYYLKEDGSAAVGTLNIDGTNYFFTSKGVNFIMVNRWNPVPEDYEVELTKVPGGREVSTVCYDALMRMMEDCKAAGCDPEIVGAYRSQKSQQVLFNNKLADYRAKGYSNSYAYSITSETVAIPGTSEHQLGLALDILDEKYPRKYSGDDNSLVWMGDHCWEYGFIVRYPNEKTDITAIKFEPWHFRYVGVELAMEMKDSGLCLEEYLDQLTGDGTTCGNPDAQKAEE